MGEQIAEKNMARLDELLATYEGKKGTLIPVLQKAQDIFGYLPKEVLIHISRKMKIPISQRAIWLFILEPWKEAESAADECILRR